MAGEGTKRIIDLTEAAETQSGDYIAIDSTGRGTRKLPAGFMATAEDLSEEQTARQTADATLDGKITSETQARIAADNEIGEQITALDEKTEADAALIQNPTKTVSGSLVSFTDGADMPMVACTAEITPKQSGTGTPSPDNVRPISGWESVSVYKSGKNLLKVDSVNTVGRGITQTLNEDGTITLSGTSTSNYNGQGVNGSARLKLPAGTYRFVDVGETSGATFYYYLRVQGNSAWIQSGQTFTVSEGSGCWIVLYFPANTAVSGTHGLMIVSENSTYDTFEPYTGTTTTVNLERTVYGGTLDVVSGALTAYPFYPSYNGETLNGRWVCDRAVYAEGTTPPTGSQVALISGTGTTYTLTPTEVKTLLGENNVWADSGDVEITYRRDISIVINNLESALNG